MTDWFLNAWWDALSDVHSFSEAGGDVLYLIALTAFILWVLLLERFIYVEFIFHQERKKLVQTWEEYHDRDSWWAKRYREMLLSQANSRLSFPLPIIKSLVAICPMLGLMGTVTGMIEVFDVVSLLGTGNARALASGVSKATIPTMTGMIVGLSGIFLLYRYQHRIDREQILLSDHLRS